jgi:hypothetical protein
MLTLAKDILLAGLFIEAVHKSLYEKQEKGGSTLNRHDRILQNCRF